MTFSFRIDNDMLPLSQNKPYAKAMPVNTNKPQATDLHADE